MEALTLFKKTMKADTQENVSVKVCMHVRGVARTDGRVLREASALVEAGCAVTIVDIEHDLSRPAEEDMDGVRLVHLLKPHWFIPPHSTARRFIRSLGKLISTTVKLLQVSADVYHAHDDNTLLPCYIAARWRRKPLVFDAHEMPLSWLESMAWRPLRALLMCFFTHLLQYCAGVITVSPPIAEAIREYYRVSSVTLVRNVLAYRQVAKSDRLRQLLELTSETRIALYQGNLQADRGLELLVHAAAYLRENIVLVLMGKNIGNAQTQLEALISTKKVGNRVKLLAPVPYQELLDWTASADVGLIVYESDSANIRWCLPNKLFEYLMAGLPVLASSLEAVEEIITMYAVGRIIPSLTPAEVGAAINAILADSASLEYMHQNALCVVQSELCWERESQQLIKLYQRLLKTGRDEAALLLNRSELTIR
jgi:glycosyltransferase involved in cell wall biosynthesis